MINRLIILTLVLFSYNLRGFGEELETYSPYPILFVHGINSDFRSWDTARNFPDFRGGLGRYFHPDSIGTEYLHWYCDPDHPEKDTSYLEAFSFSDNVGSIDYYRDYPEYPKPFKSRMNSERKGQADELKTWVEYTLEKYYGSNWSSNPDAKIIIIAHSMGCATTRGFVKDWLEDGKDPRHIWKIITVDGANNGSDLCYLEDYLFPAIIVSLVFAPTTAAVLTTALVNAGFMTIVSTKKIKMIYSQATKDLHKGSNFLDNVNDANDKLAGSGIKWYSLIGRRSLLLEALSPHMIAWGTGLIVAGCIPPFNPGLVWWGSQLVVSGGVILWWEWNSDLVIDTKSQNLNKIYSKYNAETKKIEFMEHSEAKEKWQTFCDFLEDPPVISWESLTYNDNSTETIIDNGEDLTSTGGAKGIKAARKPDKVYGRIDDYLLASGAYEWKLNRGNWTKLIWGTNLGTNGNSFVLDGLADNVVPGYNTLKMRTKNVVGECGNPRSLYLIWDRYGTRITNITPEWNDCFGYNQDIPVSAFFKNTFGIVSESLFVYAPSDTYRYSLYQSNPSDKDGNTATKNLVGISNEEGEYQLELVAYSGTDGGNSTSYSSPFYVDSTQPVVAISTPVTEDSSTYSPRVTPEMPIVFQITDNLQDVIFKPSQNGKVNIEIQNFNNAIIWNTIVMGCSYSNSKRVLWNFRDTNGDTVLQSGKYKTIVSTSDKAGNIGSDTTYFFIDTEPPQIALIEPLYPNPFVKDNIYMELAYKTNEHTELNVKFIDITDTSLVYTRMAYGDSIVDGSENDWDTCYFFEGGDYAGNHLLDGIYSMEITAKDDAGNEILIPTPLGIGVDTLRVDRTAPLISQLNCYPWIVKNNFTTLSCQISEVDDDEVNWFWDSVKVYVGGLCVRQEKISSPEASAVSWSHNIDMSGFSNGSHTVRIEVIDSLGNISTEYSQVVKNTIGSLITYPCDLDTFVSTTITIKGIANDPDMSNQSPDYDFDYYLIEWATAGSGNWQSNSVTVPDFRRDPNGLANQSNQPAPSEAILGYINLSDLPEGLLDIKLVSVEKKTGNTTADTITLFNKTEGVVTVPSITLLTANPDVLILPSGELKIDYLLEEKPSNIDINALGPLPSKKSVFHCNQYNVMPYKEDPGVYADEGFYLYKDNDKWWIKCTDTDTFFTFYKVTVEGITPGNGDIVLTDTSNVTVLFEDSKVTFFVMDTAANGIIGFTSTYKEIKFDFYKNEVPTTQIYVGKSRASAVSNNFVIDTLTSISWNGRFLGGGCIPSGDYIVRVKASGIDGQGVDSKEDTILVTTDFGTQNFVLTK